ncbi:MAG: hypothetical protein JNK15_14970 [Planctomycetes bacterium]|nr:hypothetical protein [Planctomycetota bacterium]
MNPLPFLSRFLPLLAFGATLCAQAWTEVDAGQLPRTAETTVGDGPLQRIDGALSANGDVDLYLIRVDDPATFECSTVGGAAFDTQLWMFRRDGRGIAFRDDTTTPIVQATLTGQFLGGPGHVLVGVSAWDNDPLDAFGQELWQDAPYVVERQPDGAGAANPMVQWDPAAGNYSGSYSLFLRGASFAKPTTPSRPDVAWAWVTPPNANGTFVPDVSFQRTPSGELVTVERLAQGRFRVDFPSMGSAFDGVPHVTAWFGNHTVVLRSWAPAGPALQVFVDVFNIAGVLVDEPFLVHYRRGGEPTMRSAYVWANDPLSASYMPIQTYNWNGNRGFATVQRIATGYYQVTLPGLAPSLSGKSGSVQVTPMNGSSGAVAPRRASVLWLPQPTSLLCVVYTYDALGNPSDGMFTLSYHETAAPIPSDQGSGAYVVVNTGIVLAPGFADSNGTAGPLHSEVFNHLGTGVYDVVLPSVVAADSATVQVCLYGNTPGHASVNHWGSNGGGPTHVRVDTFDASGFPSDRGFSLSYLTDRPARHAATNAVVGSGCHGPVLRARTRPLLGGTWTFDLTGLPPGSALGLAMVGLQNPNLPLDFLGAPGCVLLQDALSLAVLQLPLATPAYGLFIPANPVLLGAPVYVQGATFTSGINALGMTASNAIRGVVGDN